VELCQITILFNAVGDQTPKAPRNACIHGKVQRICCRHAFPHTGSLGTGRLTRIRFRLCDLLRALGGVEPRPVVLSTADVPALEEVSPAADVPTLEGGSAVVGMPASEDVSA